MTAKLARAFGVAAVACAAVAAVGAAVGAAEKRPFAVADLYRLVGVEEPVMAPDGSAVVYTLTRSDLSAMKRSSNLWRIAPDGSGARALTTSDARDFAPAFSADGRTLAFISTRSGEPQVWFLPWDGGEARQVTHWPGGVGSFQLSPDGTRLAFTADIWMSCGGEAECNRGIDAARDASKLKAHLADRLLFRHWNEWRDGRRTHILLQDLASGAVRDLTPGDFDSPVFSVGGGADYAFSPDGKELVFASNRNKDEASSTNADLWAVAVDAPDEALATPRRLTDNPAWDGSPAFSPDGRLLAFRMQKLPGWESDRVRIAVLDRTTRNVRVLTEGFDNTISDFVWTRDGKRIVFKAEVRGRTPLHELEVATGRVRVLTDVGQIDAFAVAPDASWMAVSRRRVGSPQELHVIALRPRPGERRLTTHNAAVEAEVDIRPAEEIFVPGAEGKPVQVFIVTPHGFDPARKYPLILNIHGGPQSQWTDSFRGDWQVYPGAGYVVAFPNPHGSYGFGEAYTAAISRDWNGKVMEDIERVTDALAALPYVDAERMGVMGWSWGGYAVMWLQGHSKRYKAMAAMMGVYDLRSMYSSTEELWFPHWDLGGAPWENREHYRTASPSEAVESFGTPCLVITGQKDYRVPYTQSVMFFTDLQKRGVPSRLLVFENAGHWPAWYEMALYYTAHLDWFHRHLGGGPAPWDPRKLIEGGTFVTE
ncbi:MAG TPA: S9 family peptidase [Thermoanaerobaculaceae bacterium]|nr:S9 family peptidase [Thermoanaerobaculaceae bacterium]HRS16199.1 S9 family peptidase [Thermoanaerobaculaceae bacterium]